MGFFSRSKPTPAEEADDHRASGRSSARDAAALRAVGADRAADRARRSAATHNVVARYRESGRCQFGHRNCTATDH